MRTGLGACGLLVALAAPARGQTIEVKPDSPAANASAAADLLQAPGADRYGTKLDWNAIPAWRKTQFFGIRARGQVFVYVVDCSGSMADGGRLLRAKAEIR